MSWLIRRDKATSIPVLPQGHKHVPAVLLIVLAQDGLDSLACFLCMVVRHGREQMVSYMGVSDVMKQDIQEAIAPINSGQSSPEPVPFLAVVVRQVWVSVLHQCDQHQPVIDNQVWDDVSLQQPQPAKALGQAVQATHDCHKGQVADCYLAAHSTPLIIGGCA